MRLRLKAFLASMLVGGALCAPACAELLIDVDKDSQRMTVTQDGQTRYVWPVSTGVSGYDTPNGAYKPFRMEPSHFSKEFDNAPMPHAIFFSQIGHAIHGTNQTRHLGRAASHGCVRLAPRNAATLYALVKSQKMANTRVVIEGSTSAPTASVNRPDANARVGRQRGYDEDDGVVQVGTRSGAYRTAPARRGPYDPFGAADPYARRGGYGADLGW